MSLRSDIVSFWFWGYRGDWMIELQAPVFRFKPLGSRAGQTILIKIRPYNIDKDQALQ